MTKRREALWTVRRQTTVWRMPKRWMLGACAAVVATAVAWSLASFVASATVSAPVSVQKADGIIVLTGGDRRLAAGLRLLEHGAGKRMLVSGVNRDTSREMLRRAQNVGPNRLFSCCTDLGYEASDTAGNASEARDWVASQGYASVIVVTANYHMPRSLAELSNAMPDVRLIPYPVDPRGVDTSRWWTDGPMIRAMGREYLKYMRCTLRMGLEQAVEFVTGGERHAQGVGGGDRPPRPQLPVGLGPI